MEHRREPLEIGCARGVRYARLPDELALALGLWADEGRVDATRVLKEDRVWQVGAWLLKAFPPGARWRGSRARRSAERHYRVLPIRTPAPLAALSVARGARRGASLLATEFVEGTFLPLVWPAQQEAGLAFARFLADMHGRRVFHGDFHLGNVLWSGAAWVLIDLDGLRHPLRTLRPRTLALETWARVLLGLELYGLPADERVRGLFDEYLRASGFVGPRDAAWQAVLASHAQLRASRARVGRARAHPAGPR